MTRLSEMPNLGKIAEKRLQAVGIMDAETLLTVGSWEAFARLRLLEGDTCFSTLCGLEGAVKGIRWHYLSDEEKKKLKHYFDSFKRNEWRPPNGTDSCQNHHHKIPSSK